jgi:SAM-dependent methyltransferase
MGRELDNNYYDQIYKNGGHNKKYFEDAHLIKEYYPSWEIAYKYIKDNDIDFVIDLGCGPGHLSSIFSKKDNINYIGYDFSEVAIQQAIKRNETNKNNKFIIKDLKEFENDSECKFYTSFEFLEHISFDKDILSKLNKGDVIIFSVPNYDSDGHVRFFKNESEIEKRYGDILNLEKISITKVKSHKIFIYKGERK